MLYNEKKTVNYLSRNQFQCFTLSVSSDWPCLKRGTAPGPEKPVVL